MRVEDIMTSKVFTVEPQDLIDRAFFLILYEGIRHLPVVEKGKVVGIISDRDMYKALGPKSNSNAIEVGSNNAELHVTPKKVQHIMHRGVVTVQRETYASIAAALMAEKRIGALPVVGKDNMLVGIISATDILRVFSKIEKSNELKENKASEMKENKSSPVSDSKKVTKKHRNPKPAA